MLLDELVDQMTQARPALVRPEPWVGVHIPSQSSEDGVGILRASVDGGLQRIEAIVEGGADHSTPAQVA